VVAIRIAPPADRRPVAGVTVAADAARHAVTLRVIPAAVRVRRPCGPGPHVALLAASSLLHAWGISSQYTLVAEHLLPPSGTAGRRLGRCVTADADRDLG
jgi:hypothetical protein